MAELGIHGFYALFSRFRRSRMNIFYSLFPKGGSVIDFGGSAATWDRRDGYSVILLNSFAPTNFGALEHIVGDGCNAPFQSDSYDIAFSNSVIEHVGDWKQQQMFASEMRRVGKGVFCQTPNRWFPVDPHSLTPFLHWLPQRFQTKWLFRVFGIRFWFSYNEEELEPARMLSKRKMEKLFPDCRIITERFLGFPKSYIAFRP